MNGVCAAHVIVFLLSVGFNLTGKPFIHPDGSAVVYNPAALAPTVGRNPQQGKTPQQPIPAPTQQQQPANHLHSQVSGRDLTVSSFTLNSLKNTVFIF